MRSFDIFYSHLCITNNVPTTVKGIKEELRKYGSPLHGNKAELLARLMYHREERAKEDNNRREAGMAAYQRTNPERWGL